VTCLPTRRTEPIEFNSIFVYGRVPFKIAKVSATHMCWRLQRRGEKEEIPSQGSGLREQGKEEKIIGQAEAKVVLSVRLIGRNALVMSYPGVPRKFCCSAL
jgi:hypothetical protein